MKRAGVDPSGPEVEAIKADSCLGPCFWDGNAALIKAEEDFKASFGNNARVNDLVVNGRKTLKEIQTRALACPLAVFPSVQEIFKSLDRLMSQDTNAIVKDFIKIKMEKNQ